MNEPSAAPGAPEHTRVFLSYSRKDKPTASRIAEALARRGCDVLMDVEDIGIAEDWRGRLEQMIRRCDAVTFAMSANSLASDVCGWEIGRAQELSKRLIPLVLDKFDTAAVPAELARLNWLDLTGVDAATFDARMDALNDAVIVDINWLREHTRLVELAARWDADARAESHLLRARAIDDANSWATRRGPQGPMLPQVLLDYLDASRAKEEADRARLERSEHEARLKAVEALYERAAAQIKSAEPHAACVNLLSAIAAAPPSKVPDAFTPTPAAPGWARKALTLLAHTVTTLPERTAQLPWKMAGYGRTHTLAWFDKGARAAWIDGKAIKIGDLARPNDAPTQLRLGGGPLAIAGAALAPRLCALFGGGAFFAVDLTSNAQSTAQLDLASRDEKTDRDRAGFAVALSDAGELALLSRAAGAARVAEIYDFAALNAAPRLSVQLPPEIKKPTWAAFERGGTRFAIAGGETLAIYASDGTLQSKRPWTDAFGAACGPDFSAGVTCNYDLARLWRPRASRFGDEAKSSETEDVTLEGAEAMFAGIAFLDGAKSVIGWDYAGHGVLWTPEETLERGMSFQGAVITQFFGRANRAKPAMRLEGMPDIRALCVHPTQPMEVLVASNAGLEVWRFPRAEVSSIKSEETGPCAVVAFNQAGALAIGSENGLWLMEMVTDGFADRMETEGATIWDLDWRYLDLISVSGASVSLTSTDMPELGETFATLPRAASCVAAGDTHWIGTNEGEIWRWAPPDLPQRWCALGLGRLKRLRVCPEAGFGAAVGADREEGTGGVAVFDLSEPGTIWRSDDLYPNDLDISADGTRILVGAQTGGALMLDAKTGAVLTSIIPPQLDPSKPAAINAVCFSADGASAYLGQWDGSVAHVDVWTGETFSHWRAHAKFVSDLSLDSERGFIATASPAQESMPVVVRRAWDTGFLAGDRMHPDWAAQLQSEFERRFGSAAARTARREQMRSLHVERQDEGDLLARARELAPQDSGRAADLLALAWRKDLGARMSAEERGIVARTLIAAGRSDLAGALVTEAATADPELEYQLGLQKAGAHRILDLWRAALPHFEVAARAGHVQAALAMADFYDGLERGIVGLIDWRAIARPSDPHPITRTQIEALAIYWMEFAAERGAAGAAFRLAQVLRAEGDIACARRRLQQAGALGHPSAIAALNRRS